jgi:hypothetical protein
MIFLWWITFSTLALLSLISTLLAPGIVHYYECRKDERALEKESI